MCIYLVASTKERHQKLNRCWDLVENLYNINFRDTSAEISYLEGGWGMPPFNYYSWWQEKGKKKRALWLRSSSVPAACFPTWNQSCLIPITLLETNCDNTRRKNTLFIKISCWNKSNLVSLLILSFILEMTCSWWGNYFFLSLLCISLQNYYSHLKLSLMMFDLPVRAFLCFTTSSRRWQIISISEMLKEVPPL